MIFMKRKHINLKPIPNNKGILVMKKRRHVQITPVTTGVSSKGNPIIVVEILTMNFTPHNMKSTTRTVVVNHINKLRHYFPANITNVETFHVWNTI